MKDRQISKAVIKRLPRYRRYLKELEKKGVEKISSKDLSVAYRIYRFADTSGSE